MSDGVPLLFFGKVLFDKAKKTSMPLTVDGG